MHCVGCGRMISWNGDGVFSYTCPCEATMFADEKGSKVAIPVSLVMATALKKPLPHINYYVGCSNFSSPEKDRIISQLKDLGCRWAWECEECRLRFTMRMMLRKAEGLYRFELHPELQMLINVRLPAEFRLLNQSAVGNDSVNGANVK